MPLSPACVAEVTSDTPFEEALAALAREDAVVFSTGLVAAHHAVHHAGLVVVSGLHVAASRLGRAVLLIPPQVALVPQPVGAPIGISPAPAHHGHRLVTEPLQKKMGQAAKISGCCQGNINIKSPDCVLPPHLERISFFACLCSHLLIKSLDYFRAYNSRTEEWGVNSPQAKQADVNMRKIGYGIEEEGCLAEKTRAALSPPTPLWPGNSLNCGKF